MNEQNPDNTPKSFKPFTTTFGGWSTGCGGEWAQCVPMVISECKPAYAIQEPEHMRDVPMSAPAYGGVHGAYVDPYFSDLASSGPIDTDNN